MHVSRQEAREVLQHLIGFARARGIAAEYWLHAEHSAMLRFANSAISLNTTENSTTLSITAHRGNALGTYSVVVPLTQREVLEQAVLTADEIARHAAPVAYTRTFRAVAPQPDDVAGFDPALCDLAPELMLQFMNEAVHGLEGDAVQLSGMFSCGGILQGAATTLSDTVLLHAASDANISVVLSHAQEKWELEAKQSATQVAELDATRLNGDLALLLEHYRTGTPVQVTPGTYDVIFGADAMAALVNMCGWIGFSGGNCKRQLTFLKEAHLGQRVFHEQFSLCDDPRARATFPYAFDGHGVPRTPFPLVERGVFTAFMWPRDDADEFGAQETGHSVPTISFVMKAGTARVRRLADVLLLPRRKDVLYIPHLHYMNVVNETEGIVTCCSRFGALLLRADGSVTVPFNLRMTEKLQNIFGRVAWLSDTTTAVNTSSTYGTRNPAAVVLPAFSMVSDVNIPHTNPSF